MLAGCLSNFAICPWRFRLLVAFLHRVDSMDDRNVLPIWNYPASDLLRIISSACDVAMVYWRGILLMRSGIVGGYKPGLPLPLLLLSTAWAFFAEKFGVTRRWTRYMAEPCVLSDKHCWKLSTLQKGWYAVELYNMYTYVLYSMMSGIQIRSDSSLICCTPP